MKPSSKTLYCAILFSLSATAAVAANENANQNATDRARKHIAANPSSIRAAGNDSFVVRDVIFDDDGSEHVRFERRYSGLPVIGGDFVTHASRGQFKDSSLTIQSSARPDDLVPELSADEAIVIAGSSFGSRFDGVPTAVLVVDARNGGPVLAYDVRFRGLKADQTETDMHHIVDARTGTLRAKWDKVHTASVVGTGKTLYSGNVALTTNSIAGGFEMRDPSRGNGYTINGHTGRTSGQVYTDADNTWGNNALSDPATTAADAQYGVSMTWDYFKLVHGRNGIANDGKGAYNRVHYGRKYTNAFWNPSCFCMTYGDGDGVNFGPFDTLDIAAHEMSHGVNSSSADLIYSGESGGLNEANSDIFAALVEFYANNSNDPGDYLIGEKAYLAFPAGDRALRYMYNPFKDTRSPNCYVSTIGNLDVHYSSGLANRFFYLLAEGSGSKSFNGVDHTWPTCNGGSVTGVGRDKAGRIWYRALTVYMTSNTNYAAARVATLNAASDLYGAGSAEFAAVAAAWSAVLVN